MILNEEEKKEGIVTTKNLEKALISFAVITSIYLSFALITSDKINIKLHLAILSIVAIFTLSLVFITSIFHFLFYKKLVEKLDIKDLKEKLRFVYISLIISATISLLLITKAIITFLNSENYEVIYYLAYLMVISFAIPVLFTLIAIEIFVMKDLSQLLLSKNLRIQFSMVIFILFIYFLNVLLGIDSIKYLSKLYALVSLFSNLVLIYALRKTMKDYLEEIKYI